ncbi:MAG: hypothetical protein F6J95_004225 [Leptolyngbya sp. SIO1E4]|nr:hypothetical protein [Leptolyngbya sp. SIO1E4]
MARNWHRRFLNVSLLLATASPIALLAGPSPFTPALSVAQAQMNHPFQGHTVVYVLSGDRWREATITGARSRFSGREQTWAYTIDYVDDQGGSESGVDPSRMRTIEAAQAEALTDTVYDLTTQAGIDQMLAAHNQVRREVEVPDLVWSEDLAAFAQAWANVLLDEGGLRHRPASERDNGRIGENLSSSWSSAGGVLSSPQRAVQGWAEEKTNYDYARNTCAPGKMCGHYTQMVWAETTEVGCAVARNEKATREVWVCNYTPAGNIIGQRPY